MCKTMFENVTEDDLKRLSEYYKDRDVIVSNNFNIRFLPSELKSNIPKSVIKRLKINIATLNKATSNPNIPSSSLKNSHPILYKSVLYSAVESYELLVRCIRSLLFSKGISSYEDYCGNSINSFGVIQLIRSDTGLDRFYMLKSYMNSFRNYRNSVVHNSILCEDYTDKAEQNLVSFILLKDGDTFKFTNVLKYLLGYLNVKDDKDLSDYLDYVMLLLRDFLQTLSDNDNAKITDYVEWRKCLISSKDLDYLSSINKVKVFN